MSSCEAPAPYEVGINDHTTADVAYATNPPTNGPHAPVWTADGDYAGQPAPRTEEVVHAQEHGRIVLQYRRAFRDAYRDKGPEAVP